MTDRLPPAVAAYYDSLDAGRPEAAAAAFSLDTVYARPSPTAEIETAPREVFRGRAALEEMLVARGHRPWRHRVLLCAAEGRDCLLEGVTESPSGEVRSSYAGTFQLGADGLIERYVAYQCEPFTDPPPATGSDRRGDAARVVNSYFEALRAGDFTAAAACFSPDVAYCHPPYTQGGLSGGTGRLYFRGRSALQAAFEKRGRTSYTHQLPVLLQRGPSALFEVATPGPDGRLLGGGVSSLSLDDEGLIQRYIAFFTTGAIRRR